MGLSGQRSANRKFRGEINLRKQLPMDHQIQIVRPFSANRRKQFNIQRGFCIAILVEMLCWGVVYWIDSSFADQVLTAVQVLVGFEV